MSCVVPEDSDMCRLLRHQLGHPFEFVEYSPHVTQTRGNIHVFHCYRKSVLVVETVLAY
ncbi:hypothetical protein X992_5213 [Burkholderia pseudomallei MSHR5492]|nr:hypothetical protein X992_5213 [Burkholderia pseudomallei MSHR5492]